MRNEMKARIARKLIRKVSNRLDEQESMDLAMDGSKELYGVISEHYSNFLEREVAAILSKVGLSDEQYREYLRCAMQIEGFYVKYPACPDAYYDLLTSGVGSN